MARKPIKTPPDTSEYQVPVPRCAYSTVRLMLWSMLSPGNWSKNRARLWRSYPTDRWRINFADTAGLVLWITLAIIGLVLAAILQMSKPRRSFWAFWTQLSNKERLCFVGLLIGRLIYQYLVDNHSGKEAKRVPGTCRECGYDLRGTIERRCPECGRKRRVYE